MNIRTDNAAESRTVRGLLAHFQKVTKQPDLVISKIAIDPEDVKVWYALLANVKGDNDEYVGGEYLIKIIANDKPRDPTKANSVYPNVPPEFYMLTPNGLYKHDEKVCVSIGEYHSDQWRPVLGMTGLCINLVSGMIGWKSFGGGINITNTSVEEKRKLAKNSSTYNAVNHPDIIKLLNESYDDYSKNWCK